MKLHNLFLIFISFISSNINAQTITIVGTGVNGWPPTSGPEITLSTTDNITYTIPNLQISNGFVKFRQNGNWTTNWGGSTFPNGQGVQDGVDIPTTAGTYDVTLNRINGTYTFITSTGFPSIGIWGPAVNSQLGYAAPDVNMITSDGIIYTLSGFYFSTGSAYFRQDNASNFVWGNVAFPTGTAVLGGPTIFVGGGEWFVTFNRLTGDYSFGYPSIGILGSALNGFNVEDTDLITNNGFDYYINGLTLSNGEVKFRKDNLWTTNWGGSTFPNGVGTQNGQNIPVIAGTYNITFEKTSGSYSFTNTLSSPSNTFSISRIYPNPTNTYWNIKNSSIIDQIEIIDISGKSIQIFNPNQTEFKFNSYDLNKGIYFLKITTGKDFSIQKIVKN